jgi:hypothetical protein
MAKYASSLIERLKPTALDRAALLTAASAFPVALNDVARALNVRRIRIQPLLCRAGVRRLVDGYEVIVNEETPGTKELIAASLEIDAPEWQKLSPTLRFWIAHELAHLIYIECADGTQPRTTEKALEKACSSLARVLVFPKRLLAGRVSAECFNPEYLVALAKEAGVSLQVLIYRLAQPDLQCASQGLDGFIALAEPKDGILVVRASHVWGPQARARFGTILNREDDRSVAMTDLHLSTDFHKEALAGKPYLNQREEVAGTNSVLPCRIHALRPSQSYLDYLVTVQVLEPPYRIAQEGLFGSAVHS